MTPLSAERVEKLSRIVEGMRVAMPAVNSQEVFNDLLAILSSHEKMRAENEGLREQHKTDEGVNLRLCEMHTNQQKELHNLGKAYKKAEASGEKERPKCPECGGSGYKMTPGMSGAFPCPKCKPAPPLPAVVPGAVRSRILVAGRAPIALGQHPRRSGQGHDHQYMGPSHGVLPPDFEGSIA